MNYLFFDIECACVYKNTAKICAFGYVLTDGDFQVLEKEDILLNPKGKFHLTGRKGDEGIVLPYTYEDFKAYPAFPKEYPRIRKLLEDKENLVCGHATMNDVNYLNLETKRYKLPSLRFRFYDTQFLYMNIRKDFTRQYGLQTMAEDLGVEFVPHRAADDAYATMRVAKVLCEREGLSLSLLAQKYNVRPGSIENYKIVQATSKGQQRFFTERDEKREAHARAHEEFYRYVNKNMGRRSKGGAFEGKVFCFSKDIEDDVEVSRRLVGAIFASGGRYTSHPTECDVYIARNGGDVRSERAVTAGAALITLETLEQALETI